MKNILFTLLLMSLLLMQDTGTVQAGGSSAQINETNVRDKTLISGKSDQLLMSFTIEPGDLKIEGLGITCAPSHGLTNLKLMHGSTELKSTTFTTNENNTNQTAQFGPIDYVLPIGETNELSLLVTVAPNVGDFITACAIDQIYLKYADDSRIFGAEAQANDFSGINRLIYIDDPNSDNGNVSYNIYGTTIQSADLPIDSKNNLLLEFNVNASENINLKDLFIYCNRGNVIENYRLEANGVSHTYTAMQNNWSTISRPEHSSADRVVFANLNKITGPGEGVNFKLYGDTYDYFKHLPGDTVSCSVIDINTTTNISSAQRLKEVTDRETSLLTFTDTSLTNKLLGKILLQVESNGQAWYVDPVTKKKYYLPDGNIAYQTLRHFGLGITNADLKKIPVGIINNFTTLDSDGDGLDDKLEESLKTDAYNADTDNDGFKDGNEVLSGYDPLGTGRLNYQTSLINQLKGRILLQVESRGEAWYVNPNDGKRYYLKDGNAAYEVMRYLSLGILNKDIRKVNVGEINTAQ